MTFTKPSTPDINIDAEKMRASFWSMSRICGGSYGKTPRVIKFHSSSLWKSHFEASKQTSKLMVIDFTATWCGPCQAMEPVINDMAAKYTDVEFIKIDVDELESVSAQFGVQAMPTFILLKNGNEVDKVVGAKKDELQMKVEKHRVQAQVS